MRKKRITLIISCILLLTFVAGYGIATKVLYPRTTEEEFEYYEKVVWDIYDQYEGYHILPYIPDDVKVRIENNTILVGKAGVGAFAGAGYIEGIVKEDDSFVVNRVFSELERVMGNVGNGLKYCSIIVLVLVIISIIEFLRKRREGKSKNVSK